MADFTVVNAGEKLQVGQIPTDFPGLGSKLVPGTAVINGPVYIGAALQGGIPTAACMIGPPLLGFPASLDVKGISNFTGISNFIGIVNVLGNQIITGNLNVTGAITGPFPAFWSSKKNFDIPHPTKEGWRLRHTCPEGPSNDVYFRGKVKNKNYIELPQYWKEFVDFDSITVSLTEIGAHQDVIVKRIDEDKIHLQARGGMPIDCHYIIFGERLDGEKLIPEYEGLTSDDYPGDNNEYNINT